MGGFTLNGYFWAVEFVDPMDSLLIDRDGDHTLATTDPTDRTVRISSDLTGDMLLRVLLHEIGHCALFSFGLLEDIRRMTRPEYRAEMEEWACNLIADYGLAIFSAAYSVLGEAAIEVVPYRIEQIMRGAA